MSLKRESWIDYVKLIACTLVVLGHFFQSMTAAEILPATPLYEWFNSTIYYFHVQLFFICSGYLYQRYSRVNTLTSWAENAFKKLIALGIPYFAFSIVTWVMKNIFSESVNIKTEGLLESLFVNPLSPYWYLFVLFFIFLITPTIPKNVNPLLWLGAAFVLKAVAAANEFADIYIVQKVFGNEIWFVIGMCLCAVDISKLVKGKKWLTFSIGTAVAFTAASILLYMNAYRSELTDILMGAAACCAVITGMLSLYKAGTENKILDKMASYTMPVFLMHTIFSAGLRSVLFKLGIESATVHVTAGLIIGFAGPVIAYEIMKLIKLDVLIFPGKYIKLPRRQRNGKEA